MFWIHEANMFNTIKINILPTDNDHYETKHTGLLNKCICVFLKPDYPIQLIDRSVYVSNLINSYYVLGKGQMLTDAAANLFKTQLIC